MRTLNHQKNNKTSLFIVLTKVHIIPQYFN